MKKRATVLVTGGAGYIGRHVVKRLMDEGHFPVVLDNSLPRYGQTPAGSVRVNGSVEDVKMLSKLFTQYEFDAVLHFAAYPEILESFIDPVKYHQNNISATLVLLESMLNYGVRQMIFSSSAAVYGEPRYTPIDEDHPCGPHTRCGHSKYFLEKVLHDCSLLHGLRHITLRHFTVAGYNPEHTAEISGRKNGDIITSMIDVAAGIKPMFDIFGTDYETRDGTCIRDYIHVDDVATAYVVALEHLLNGARSNVYNIGSGRGHSVREVLEKVQNVTGRTIPAAVMPRRPGDSPTIVAMTEKIQTELQWRPRFYDLKAIIQTTWDWYRKRFMPNWAA